MEESGKASNENTTNGLSSSSTQRSNSDLQNLQNERGNLSRSYSSLSNSNYSTYNTYSPSSYSSYSGSPYSSYYGGYGSTYGGYSGYGGYGSSYGGYGTYGSTYNSYSNQYSKPVRPEEAQNQPPQPNIRQDVWGFLNGFHAILNILYAATGMVHFGKMFLKMTIKVLKAAGSKTLAALFKLTGIKFLQQLVQKLAVKENWFQEFDTNSTPLDLAWNSNTTGKKGGIFKILTLLRIFALAGTLVSFFLKKKVSEEPQVFQAPPISEEEKNRIEAEHKMEEEEKEAGVAKVIEYEDAKSLYNHIKMLKKMSVFERTYSSLEVVQEVNEEAKPESPLLRKSKTTQENSPSLSTLTEAIESATITTAKNDTKEEVSAKKEVEITEEKSAVEVKAETQQEEKSPDNDKLRSEEFWKSGQQLLTKSFSIDESKLNQDKKKEEEPFELPSMLKSTSTTGKKPAPWLVRKKEKSPTVAIPQKAETNVSEMKAESEPLKTTEEI